MAGADQEPRRGAGPKPWRWALGAVGALLALVALWIAAHQLAGRSLPPPRWTLADLPAAPASADNGFRALARLSARPSIPETPASVVLLPTAGQWSQALTHRAELAAFEADPAAHAALEAANRAFGAPRFADDCPVRYLVACPILPAVRYQRALLLQAFARAVESDWPAALQTVRMVLRADLDLLASARSLLNHAAAMRMALEATAALETLVTAYTDAPHTEGLEQVEAIRTLLSSVDPTQLHAERAIVHEYLMASDLLRQMQPSLDGLMLDRRQTLQMLAEHFESYLPAAGVAGAAPAVPRDPTATPLWWLYNPTGKQMMRVMVESSAIISPRLRVLQRERRELLAALRRIERSLPRRATDSGD